MNELQRWLASQKTKMVGYQKIAAACGDEGVRWQQPQKWITAGVVPLKRVAAVSRVTGIPAAKLNPHVAEILKGAA